jgi:DNA-binding response OmpR family regulator
MVQSESRPLVLVVDDDEDHLLMLEALLDAAGYEVVTAGSCAAGRKVLHERPVDALLADLSLGDGTALDLLRDIGASRPRVAIVLSGFDSIEDVTRTLQAGYDAHLAKPTPVELLRETIANGLRHHPSGVRVAASKSGAGDVALADVPALAAGAKRPAS